MELDLKNYTTDALLGSYEFVLGLWMGGACTPDEVTELVPTIYIFEQVLSEIRTQYLGRKDGTVEAMTAVENGVKAHLVTIMNLTERQQHEVAEKMLIQIERSNRELRIS